MRPRSDWSARPRQAPSVAALVALSALLALLGALVVVPSTPARADDGDVIVAQGDPRGDVESLGRVGPGTVGRTSIDLRAFSLAEQKTGVRMTVTLQRILVRTRYEQVVEVQMKPATTGGTWFLDVAMNGQDPASAVASYSPDLSGESFQTCKLTTVVNPDASTLSLFVPDECLPVDAAKIKVFSSLGNPRGGPGYSLDRMRVRGSYLMHS